MNKIIILIFSFVFPCMVFTIKAYKYPKRASFRARKGYVRKTPYAGFGKRSTRTGFPKTKIVNGHGKMTRRGYTYVDPYARSR